MKKKPSNLVFTKFWRYFSVFTISVSTLLFSGDDPTMPREPAPYANSQAKPAPRPNFESNDFDIGIWQPCEGQGVNLWDCHALLKIMPRKFHSELQTFSALFSLCTYHTFFLLLRRKWDRFLIDIYLLSKLWIIVWIQ